MKYLALKVINAAAKKAGENISLFFRKIEPQAFFLLEPEVLDKLNSIPWIKIYCTNFSSDKTIFRAEQRQLLLSLKQKNNYLFYNLKKLFILLVEGREKL